MLWCKPVGSVWCCDPPPPRWCPWLLPRPRCQYQIFTWCTVCKAPVSWRYPSIVQHWLYQCMYCMSCHLILFCQRQACWLLLSCFSLLKWLSRIVGSNDIWSGENCRKSGNFSFHILWEPWMQSASQQCGCDSTWLCSPYHRCWLRASGGSICPENQISSQGLCWWTKYPLRAYVGLWNRFCLVLQVIGPISKPPPPPPGMWWQIMHSTRLWIHTFHCDKVTCNANYVTLRHY